MTTTIITDIQDCIAVINEVVVELNRHHVKAVALFHSGAIDIDHHKGKTCLDAFRVAKEHLAAHLDDLSGQIDALGSRSEAAIASRMRPAITTCANAGTTGFRGSCFTEDFKRLAKTQWGAIKRDVGGPNSEAGKMGQGPLTASAVS